MIPWAARARGPGHKVRTRYLEWKIPSVNLEVLQYRYSCSMSVATLKRGRELLEAWTYSTGMFGLNRCS